MLLGAGAVAAQHRRQLGVQPARERVTLHRRGIEVQDRLRFLAQHGYDGQRAHEPARLRPARAVERVPDVRALAPRRQSHGAAAGLAAAVVGSQSLAVTARAEFADEEPRPRQVGHHRRVGLALGGGGEQVAGAVQVAEVFVVVLEEGARLGRSLGRRRARERRDEEQRHSDPRSDGAGGAAHAPGRYAIR